MTIKGTAFSAGFEAPKIEKIYEALALAVFPRVHRDCSESTYTQDDDEQEVDVSDVVELEPQILGYETERRVFGCSYLVARVVGDGVSVVVAFRLGQGHVEVDSPAWVLLVASSVGARGRMVTGTAGLFAQRVSLLSARAYAPVQALLEGVALVVSLDACGPVCCPSYPLYRIGNLCLAGLLGRFERHGGGRERAACKQLSGCSGAERRRGRGIARAPA